MAGTIGVICDLAGRYSQFWICLNSMHRPVNTHTDFQPGSDRGASRNSIVERSLERGSEWLLFLDDDHAFPVDHLGKLLAVEQPVVASLYAQRANPFLPIAYAEKDENGYWPLDLRHHGPLELVKVRAAGTGGMLIRSEVFRQIPAPWFVHTTEKSEDLYFCDLLHDAGIPMYVHTGAVMGHIAPSIVWPEWHAEEERWVAGLNYAQSGAVLLDIDWSVVDERGVQSVKP